MQHRQPKGPTIQDVASRAGVSIATVSRVLNNADYPVSPHVRKSVMQAARDLHYTPNLLGRMLQSNSNTAIGVIVPTLQNPFFNQVILGVESAARTRDYEVIIYSSHRSVAQERKNILSLLQKRVMGLLIVSIDSHPTALEQYMEYGGRVALLESDFKLSACILAQTDYFSAGTIAAQYLADRGHRRIAFLTAPITKFSRQQILAGIQDALRRAEIPFSEADIFVANTEAESDTGMYEFELGRQLVDQLLQRREPYSAIIAINDITAFGVIQALNQYGISIPGQMSVIGFDNITYSGMLSPPLTTVALPSSSMGSAACQMLIDALNKEGVVPPQVSFSFPCYLEERQSVREIPGKQHPFHS